MNDSINLKFASDKNEAVHKIRLLEKLPSLDVPTERAAALSSTTSKF